MITVVIFKAFDKTCKEPFIHGEDWETINEALLNICNTYVPLHIVKADESEPISLSVLNQFKQQENAIHE